MPSSHRQPEDLTPQETGFVHVTRASCAHEPPSWRPQLVLTPGADTPGAGLEVMQTPVTIEDFVGFLAQQLEAGAARPLDESALVLRPSEVLALFELVHELGFVYAGTPLSDLARRLTKLLQHRL